MLHDVWLCIFVELRLPMVCFINVMTIYGVFIYGHICGCMGCG